MNGPVVLDHRPIRPPRAGHIGEQVFADRWRALMDRAPHWIDPGDRGVLGDILANLGGRPRQRDASLAASFIMWLGTNIGQAYLFEANRLAKTWPVLGQAYVAQFALENLRLGYVNFGRRLIETLMLTEEQLRQESDFGLLACLRMRAAHVEATAADVEVVEHVAYWLGTTAGQAMIRGAQAEMKCRQDAVWQQRKADLAANIAAGGRR